MNDNTVMTSKEVAQYLNVSLPFLYKHCKNGEIPSYKVGGLWRFRRNEIKEWFEDNFNQKSKKN